MEYIKIDKNIFVQIFQYEDKEEFVEICNQSEKNYFALKSIWNSEMIYKLQKKFTNKDIYDKLSLVYFV